MVGSQIGNQFFSRAFRIHLCFFRYAWFAFVDLFADGLDFRTQAFFQISTQKTFVYLGTLISSIFRYANHYHRVKWNFRPKIG
jgi:hypothetical protein